MSSHDNSLGQKVIDNLYLLLSWATFGINLVTPNKPIHRNSLFSFYWRSATDRILMSGPPATYKPNDPKEEISFKPIKKRL